MGQKVCCFAGFFNHRLMTTSAHMHVHRYPFFENTGLCMFTLRRKHLQRQVIHNK